MHAFIHTRVRKYNHTKAPIHTRRLCTKPYAQAYHFGHRTVWLRKAVKHGEIAVKKRGKSNVI